ncbi:hypothetical protein BOX15_Mlig033405g1 [Macrostomum lignano]|uniref:Uncharacterized protein n=1 Tax=Macrostomum lignano TaxID=282301 RepID=A0A267E1F5_9PLAT|nr:hypothetical protein BOX15_Mlig033405g1 [Macrostomum lignano]
MSEHQELLPVVDKEEAYQYTENKRTFTWKTNSAAQLIGAALPYAKAAAKAAEKAVENAKTDHSATADSLKAATRSIQDGLGSAKMAAEAAEQAANAAQQMAAASGQGGASRLEAKAKLVQLTESAAKDLVRALEGTGAVAKTASGTIETPERLALAHTASKLVLSCARAAAGIAAESKRLSETLASPQADQFVPGVNKINRINDGLGAELRSQWESIIQTVEGAAAAAEQTATSVQATRLENTVETARRAEAEARTAADVTNLFSVAAEHGLLKFKAEAIKAAAAAAKELVTASVETVKLATEASIAAGENDANACKSAVSVASRCACRCAWHSAEAAQSAASNDPDETIAVGAADEAKTAVDEIRKLAESQQNGSSPVRLTLDSRCKLVGFVVFFVIVMLAFVVEVRAYDEDQKYENEHQTGKRNRKICVECYVFRLLFVALAMISIVYLECRVLKSGRARLAYVGAVRISNVPASIAAPVELCNLPSVLFASAFQLFAFLKLFLNLLGIVCGAMEFGFVDSSELDYTPHGIVMLIRHALLFVFTVLQTRFFIKYCKASIQLKLGRSWLPLSIVMAANIGVWFTTVGIELQDIGRPHKEIANGTYCYDKKINKIKEFLYPFEIEYCVMSSLMAYMLMSNMGRLAEFLHRQVRSGPVKSQEIVRRVKRIMLRSGGAQGGSHEDQAQSEFASIRKHSWMISIGAVAVVASLTVVAFVHFDDENNPVLIIVLFSLQMGSHALSIPVLAVLLFCYFRVDKNRRIGSDNLVDRLLLWLGVIAIVGNNAYNFLKNFSLTIELLENFFGAVQSVLQAVFLELMLVGAFTLDNKLHEALKRFLGRCFPRNFVSYMLSFLILLNICEWVLSALCFPFFFQREEDKKEGLFLLLMPLKVFYRFHSVMSIQDFKKHHLRVETARNCTAGRESDDESGADAVLIHFTDIENGELEANG